MSTTDKINERFKDIRKTCGLTQEKFGHVLGITKAGVSDIELGRRRVTEQHITMLSYWPEHKININWLRTGDGEMFLSNPTDEFHIFVDQHQDATEIDKAVMRAYFDLNVQQREAFYEFCLRVADNSSPVEQETRWERDARLLQEEAEALKRDAEKCSALPPTKKA